MLKKTIAFILVLMAIVSVLVSCTSSGSDNSDVNTNSITVSESPAATSKDADNLTSDEASSETSGDTEASKEESSDSMTSLINGYLDIILEGIDHLDFGLYKNEASLAEKYPNETAALVNLGEAAFSALDDIIRKTNVLTRRAFAEYIKYKIKPELHDLDFPSPDGKYSIKASVYTFLYTGSTEKMYVDFSLVDNTENKVIAVSDIMDSEINVNWSTDSKYATVMYGFASKRYFKTDIFDALNSKFIKLPSYENLSEFTGTNSKYSDYYSVQFNFSKWLPDDKVKIQISTILSPSEESVEGWFIYNLKTNKVTESSYGDKK